MVGRVELDRMWWVESSWTELLILTALTISDHSSINQRKIMVSLV